MGWIRALFIALLACGAATAGTHVVLFGVEDYDDPSIAPLRYAVDDARALAEAFVRLGVSPEQVSILTSDATAIDRRPTRANVLAALGRARERARLGDQLVVFFAGHGVELDGEQYLLTVDTRRSLMAETALPTRLLSTVLEGLEADDVLFLFDVCRNNPDAAGARGEADSAMTEGIAKMVRPRHLGAPDALRPVVLLACDVGQRAWELDDEGHGAFTWFVLRGLGGEARDDAGVVTVSSLAGYVQREVERWSGRAHRPRQTPRLENPGGRDFALVAQPTSAAGELVPVPPDWPARLATLRLQPNVPYRVARPDGMPQVLVAGGEFTLGSVDGPDELRPVRRVDLTAFWMDLHEVTVEQYCRFLNEQRPPDEQRQRWVAVLGEVANRYLPPVIERAGGLYRPTDGRAQHPVVWVSWEGANAYAEWAGRALPSEAQWERAARGGLEGERYPWGNGLPEPGQGNLADLQCMLLYDRRPSGWPGILDYDDGFATTAPVCSFAASPFGLFDLEGNVREWCLDWYRGDFYGALPADDPVNLEPWTPRGGVDLGIVTIGGRRDPHRSLRGGSWNRPLSEVAVAWRAHAKPDEWFGDVGFRCVSPFGESGGSLADRLRQQSADAPVRY